MKAWVLENIGELNEKEIETPVPGKGEVLVEVKTAGICGSDIQRVYENGAHRMPLVIGHEFAGGVVGCGEGVSDSLIGKRVGVFPLIPCRKCRSCRNKQYEMCTGYSYLGSRTHGGFAEYVTVPAWNLVELEEGTTYEQAAMLEPMAVAVHAMRRLNLTEDSTVCVCGLGTIGQLLIMFLKERGIRQVYAIGKSETQKQSVIQFGVLEEDYCDSRIVDANTYLMEQTADNGVDVFFDCVGKNETIVLGLEVTAAGGQVCLVGNPYGNMEFSRDTYWKILRKQLRVTGTWNSTYLGEEDKNAKQDDWHYVLERLKGGNIHPEQLITHRFSMEELGKGFEIMRRKSEPYLKVMMCV